MARCELCRCKARGELYSFRVCRYHMTHGESDPPCPYCAKTLFDPRWTYTPNGQPVSRMVERRQVTLPNTVFFDSTGELLLCVESVREHAPRGWHTTFRPSVVIIGIGVQMGTNFVITQWGSDWERELIDAARPVLALANKVYIDNIGNMDAELLAGTWRARQAPTWPTMDLRHKVVPVRSICYQQGIETELEQYDILDAQKRWPHKQHRKAVWQSNYYRVLNSARRIFQIEWPPREEEYRAQDT